MRCSHPDTRHQLLTRAYNGYNQSYIDDKSSYYTGINAATMALLLGKQAEAVRTAMEVQRLCESELERAMMLSPSTADTNSPTTVGKSLYWVLATLGEASIIRGHFSKAATYYRRAVDRSVHTHTPACAACAASGFWVWSMCVVLTPALHCIVAVLGRTTSC